MRLACLFLFSSSLFAQATPTTGSTPPGMSGFDSTMLQLMSTYSVPGAALAVVHNGQLVFARGYGYSDQASLTSMQPDSLFRIASVTKPHTAAAILKLIERGQLSLSDHAFTILKNLTPLPGAVEDPRIAQITIQNLLEHTSGWYGEHDGTGYDPLFDVVNIAQAAGVTAPADPTTIARYMLGRPLDTAPGAHYSYSNFGYLVLGLVIQQVSGESYESFVTANVTGPLGNSRTQFGSTLTPLPGEVTYYPYPNEPLAPSVFPTGPANVPIPYGGYSVEANHANGGLVSNTVELLRFLTSINGSRGPALFQTPVQGFPGYVPPSGANWTYFFHGSLPGNNSGLLLLPDQTAICYLTNTRPANSDAFFNDFDTGFMNAAQQVNSWPTTDISSQFQTAFVVIHAATLHVVAGAPDTFLSLFGTGLATSALASPTIALPTTLGGATVTIKDSAGTSTNAMLSYASPTQINLVVPAGAAAGAATISVNPGNGPTLSTTIQIDPVSPGIFTTNAAGTGVPAALAALYSTTGVVTPVNVYQCVTSGCTPVPMSTGTATNVLVVSLYVSGIRHASGPVTATINGQAAPVLFAGPQPQYAGLDQVNVEVPVSMAGSGTVPMQIMVDGRLSNPVTISIK